ncbi:hypothetical protein [Cellulomonas wangsupingiae]|uniref:hypothetical protein n=1 Tax=Cellulomonas wangsupingiae TaxID=2968085 RepID=UPI001D0EA2C7|nr:hypothetical protein [Cellulomonas wangsupingiae]MCM0640708.1 hypothetical protein [Cellulomonas wangsupingiae]
MDDTRDPRDGDAAGVPPTDPTVDAATGRATGPDADADADVARVRAADPAAGAAPDTARLHARLTETTGVPFASAATAPDELAAARARRRGPARWLQVAAVAAGVALVGGGGYAVGAAGADAPAAPAIALQGAGGPTAELAAAQDAARSMVAPGWFGGRTVFSGSGLEGPAGSATAWAFDASVATAATAAKVAEVLGVPGEPRLEWGQWTVGTNDGTAATVQVSVDGQASMWFYDRAWDPSTCTVGPPETLDGSTSSGAAEQEAADQQVPEPDVMVEPLPSQVVPLPEPVAPQDPAPADPSVCDPTSTPTGDAAASAARDLMTRLGVDVDGYEVTVSDDTGVPGLVSVTGAQVVDGTQTGLGWSVQLAGTGVQSVSAPLATLVELGTYDVVSADAAVERLNDPRFGASYGGVVPLAARAGGRVVQDAVTADGLAPESFVDPGATAEPTVPAVPSPGDPIAWPVQEVTITGARLGATYLSTPTGASLLVPAWELTDADGGTWSVVAVVDEQLDLSPA